MNLFAPRLNRCKRSIFSIKLKLWWKSWKLLHYISAVCIFAVESMLDLVWDTSFLTSNFLMLTSRIYGRESYSIGIKNRKKENEKTTNVRMIMFVGYNLWTLPQYFGSHKLCKSTFGDRWDTSVKKMWLKKWEFVK